MNMKMKKYFLAGIFAGLSLFFCTDLYCQTGNSAVDNFINQNRQRERDERDAYDALQRKTITPVNRDTYNPPPSEKYIYNGVEYPSKAARDAAIKRATDEAERNNFITNIKPRIDAGFKQINPTNNTSTGFREIGQSMNRYVEKPAKLERKMVAVSDKVMRGTKTTYDVITDTRVRETAGAVGNLSGKNVLLNTIDKPAQKFNQIVADAVRQKAGYARGSAKDEAVTFVVSSVTDLPFDQIKQDISDKYFPNNENSRLLVTQSPKESMNDLKETIADYLGIHSKAIDNATWYGKNTVTAIFDTFSDIKDVAGRKISVAEYNRRWEDRWKNYSKGAVNEGLK